MITLLAVALCLSCATAGVAPTAQQRVGPALAAFSLALAQAGMSVPLPPRACEEPGPVARWNDDVGCADVTGDDEREALTVYARAIVQERLPAAPAARADALVAAYLGSDDGFATMALQIERDFDAARAAKAVADKPHKAKADAAKAAAAKADAAKADTAKADTAKADSAKADTAKADSAKADSAKADTAVTTTEAGKSEAAAGEGAVDGGPPGAAAPAMSARLVGTWTTTSGDGEGVVWIVCADGTAITRVEPDDVEIWRGRWSLEEGPPARITLTQGDESYSGTVDELSDDALTLTVEGSTVRYARRSKAAVCD